MGYQTDFTGQFDLDRQLAPEHAAYLRLFNGTRRMGRRSADTGKRPDPVREAAGLPIGNAGGYFVGADGFAGQEHTDDIVDYNREPTGQPSLWCQWTVADGDTAIVWDGGEKFYGYVEWLVYLIEHFLEPWGYTLNGSVSWFGEERSDVGTIAVTGSKVETAK